MTSATSFVDVTLERGWVSAWFPDSLPFGLASRIDDDRYKMSIHHLNALLAAHGKSTLWLLALIMLSAMLIFIAVVLLPTELDFFWFYLLVSLGGSLSLLTLVGVLFSVKRLELRMNNFLAAENQAYYNSVGVNITYIRTLFRAYLHIDIRNIEQQQQPPIPASQPYFYHAIPVPMYAYAAPTPETPLTAAPYTAAPVPSIRQYDTNN
jgi:hypothetical protein